jgi:ATP-grasp domain, R2K clade family 2
MTTLLLSSRQTPDGQALWRAAIGRSWHVERSCGPTVPAHLPAGPYVIYHEALFAPLIARQLNVTLIEPATEWLAQLPGRYAQRWIEYTTLGEARRATEPRFVKPPNDKSFPAQVYASGLDLPSDFADDAPVLTAEPVRWRIEFRCFVRDRKVLTLSSYLCDGIFLGPEFTATEDDFGAARHFSESFLADSAIEMPSAVVLDVGLIDQRGWAVVELNGAWSSGIYGCDPDAVLTVLEGATVAR